MHEQIFCQQNKNASRKLIGKPDKLLWDGIYSAVPLKLQPNDCLSRTQSSPLPLRGVTWKLTVVSAPSSEAIGLMELKLSARSIRRLSVNFSFRPSSSQPLLSDIIPRNTMCVKSQYRRIAAIHYALRLYIMTMRIFASMNANLQKPIAISRRLV